MGSPGSVTVSTLGWLGPQAVLPPGCKVAAAVQTELHSPYHPGRGGEIEAGSPWPPGLHTDRMAGRGAHPTQGTLLCLYCPEHSPRTPPVPQQLCAVCFGTGLHVGCFVFAGASLGAGEPRAVRETPTTPPAAPVPQALTLSGPGVGHRALGALSRLPALPVARGHVQSYPGRGGAG